jgi:DHA1 family inner membrane transport protein
MFAVYSYITPTLLEVTGIKSDTVPFFLAVWGVGMVLGNLFGGWLADRSLAPSILGILIWKALFLATFSAIATRPTWTLANLFLIGMGFALVPALQARLMSIAGQAQTLAAALNHSAFNIANAVGAALGGIAIAHGFGWASTGWVGASLAIFAFVLMRMSYGAKASDATHPHQAQGLRMKGASSGA